MINYQAKLIELEELRCKCESSLQALLKNKVAKIVNPKSKYCGRTVLITSTYVRSWTDEPSVSVQIEIMYKDGTQFLDGYHHCDLDELEELDYDGVTLRKRMIAERIRRDAS